MCLRLLATLRLDRARQRVVSGFIDSYLRLSRREALQFRRQADSLLNGREKARVMEITTSWNEEGRLEGRVEGRTEGTRQIVLRLLRRQCGRLSRALGQQVSALSVQQCERLAEALLGFRSLADLQAWLRHCCAG